MSRFSFINRGRTGASVETSPSAPARETSGPGKSWYRQRILLEREQASINQSSQSRVRYGRQTSCSSSWLHPFKIYVKPFSSVPGVSPSYAWRTFRIRDGMVFTTTDVGINVDGTDKCDLPYSDALYCSRDGTPSTSVQEYRAPLSEATFRFWVEVNDSTAVIRYGSDPSVSTYSDGVNPDWTSTNAWTSWPAPDSTHFLLGWVDTLTIATKAFVRQVQVTDIVVSPGNGSGSINLYEFASMQGDYITCHPWSGNAFNNNASVLVAKPYKLRYSTSNANIDNTIIAYTDYDTTHQTRNATADNLSEIQIIVPRYLVGDLIYASKVNHTNVSNVDASSMLLDLNDDARAWARKFSQ